MLNVKVHLKHLAVDEVSMVFKGGVISSSIFLRNINTKV